MTTRQRSDVAWCAGRVKWLHARDGGRSKAAYCLTTWTDEHGQHLCRGLRGHEHMFPMHGCPCGARSSAASSACRAGRGDAVRERRPKNIFPVWENEAERILDCVFIDDVEYSPAEAMAALTDENEHCVIHGDTQHPEDGCLGCAYAWMLQDR